MAVNTKKIIECYNCGLFVNKESSNKFAKLKCPRCSSKLIVEKDHSIESLYYAISSLLLFAILSIYPLITLSFGVTKLEATLLDTIMILLEQNFFFVALIVFFTIIVAPILNSLIIIIFFIQKYTNLKFLTNTLLHDSFHFFKHWGFIEVFIISIIVTYIKLVGMVSSTKFDIGFYVMLIYIFCLYMSNRKFSGKSVFGE
ncbi:paraquat-inducible protein A [Poseidonibacter ostreae]|jgi:paraquat-inducible protein A|uniref:Paraquat-inducible protein A n=1 Tax=Poseidonibacter ostreae TaxID=2654171 RepID=A0A6L4WSE2_9BACT|nr:paraquat-inducible protein A [Poseidonibacter ostreae]KAB7885877.1 paraquat-inducible protein A [Poseidonibacter ostreae]KAB7888331.1 paraquat-inducible protein A [Poseidonibacter ostreae]KAB7888442.1 paraquat-inducible protein A [Poseidonibacter ostreae]MAC83028.1 paraquat-inducible protein A [Arcobacter sp.]|tara:strand:+ start:183 stop:782 length:600 start_codon:yes stop_codon:yes gene_type:complete